MVIQRNAAQILYNSIPYIKKYSGSLIVIKCGGSLIQRENLIRSICKDISVCFNLNINVILVHGGGHLITEELRIHGLNQDFSPNSGYRPTSKEALSIVQRVLSGDVNKMIVRYLSSSLCPSVGISGLDIPIFCERHEDEGEVGHPKDFNDNFLCSILSSCNRFRCVPVVSPICCDCNYYPLNVNADVVASFLASSLKAKRLIYLTDVDGVLDEKSDTISSLETKEVYSIIHSGRVHGGMLPKLKESCDAVQKGVESAVIINGSKECSLIEELFFPSGSGTLIYKS